MGVVTFFSVVVLFYIGTIFFCLFVCLPRLELFQIIIYNYVTCRVKLGHWHQKARWKLERGFVLLTTLTRLPLVSKKNCRWMRFLVHLNRFRTNLLSFAQNVRYSKYLLVSSVHAYFELIATPISSAVGLAKLRPTYFLSLKLPVLYLHLNWMY